MDTMTADSSKKVIIIGAGVAGLALAQILRANGVAFEIFERDEAPSSRQQGWSVGLAECLPELDALLPKDLGSLETVAVGHDAGILDSIALWDINENKVMNRFGGQPRGQPGWAIRSYRPKMREFLWPKVNVQTNKKLSHYTEDDTSNTVTAHFTDGSSATGGLLVGADGAWSRVRRNMMDESSGLGNPSLSAYQPVLASLELDASEFAAYKEIATSTIVCPGPDMMFTVATYKTRMDGSASVFWAVCWATDGDRAKEVAWLRESSQQDRLARALETINRTPNFPSFLRNLVERTPAENISNLPFTFSEWFPASARALPRGRATLIGDALHNMIPFRGAGANTALCDVTELARLLIPAGWGSSNEAKVGSAQQHPTDLDAILRTYEAVAVPRGREQVLLSRQIGENYRGFVNIVMKGRNSTMGTESPKSEAVEVGKGEVGAH